MISFAVLLTLSVSGAAPRQVPVLPIAGARVDADGDGTPDRLGERVAIAGRASVASYALNHERLRLFVQDATAGILLYAPGAGTVVEPGDSVEATGIVSHYNGITQLVDPEYTVIPDRRRPLAPLSLALHEVDGERYEGMLVRVRGKVLQHGGNPGGSFVVLGDPGASDATLQVLVANALRDEVHVHDYSTGDLLEVTGILGQYDQHPPYRDHYQLYPRSAADVRAIGLTRTAASRLLAAACVLILGVALWLLSLRLQVRRKVRQLREANAALQALIQSSPTAIQVLDRDGNVVLWNDAAERIFGWSAAEVVGRPYPLIPPGREAEWRRFRDLVWGGQAIGGVETQRRRKDGQLVDVSIASAPLRRPDGTIYGSVGILQDNTGRKRVEEELRRSEERFRALVEHSASTITVLDRDGIIRFISANVDRVLGIKPEALLGTPALDMVHPDDLAPAGAMLAWLLAHPGTALAAELRIGDHDGSWRTLEIIARNLLDNAAVAGIVVNASDVTERKLAEEGLQLQRTYFAELFESAPEAIVILDDLDRVVHVNGEFTRLFGYGQEEAVGRPVHELIAPESLSDEARSLTDRVLAGDKVALETVRRHKDGTPIHVSILGTPIRIKGQPTRGYGIYRDITERRKLESQLRMAQKMEAVGRLAGGVAHDFNNMLTAIKGNTDVLLEDLADDDPVRADLQEIQRAAERAVALTRQLLAFSRKQMLRPRVLDLNTLIREIERMLRRLIGEDIELETRLDPALGAVRADPGQLEQVVVNLAVNARDAMPGGGRLRIETRNVEVDEARARQLGFVLPGRYVALAVHDTGTGMDAETRSHIFEPFFTTKEQGRGTGLGLSTVYGIVKQSDGYVWAESEVGQGSTFWVYLPRVEAEVESPPPALRAPEISGGGETVLLVEDEDAVRALATRILTRRGYRVLTARTGPEAIAICTGERGPIHLVLTDVVMPRMSGRELAERVAVLRPQTRILFMSGYTEDDILRRGVLGTGSAFLEKPFTPDALAAKVREVLDAPGG